MALSIDFKDIIMKIITNFYFNLIDNRKKTLKENNASLTLT